jgi:hypothetical protein
MTVYPDGNPWYRFQLNKFAAETSKHCWFMKKLILIAALALALAAETQAREFHHFGHGGWGRPAVTFYWGAPYCGPVWTDYYYPAYGCTAGYGYDSARPNYAVNGALLGALTGGLIGNSIHHQGWEGAGIGAAAGLLVGGLAETAARHQEAAAYRAQMFPAAPTTYVVPSPPAATPVPAAVPVWNPPIKAANATYYWTAPPSPVVR